MPTKYKLLFVGQSIIFTMAIWVRGEDVERAQAIKKLEDADKQRAEMTAQAVASADDKGKSADK